MSFFGNEMCFIKYAASNFINSSHSKHSHQNIGNLVSDVILLEICSYFYYTILWGPFRWYSFVYTAWWSLALVLLVSVQAYVRCCPLHCCYQKLKNLTTVFHWYVTYPTYAAYAAIYDISVTVHWGVGIIRYINEIL